MHGGIQMTTISAIRLERSGTSFQDYVHGSSTVMGTIPDACTHRSQHLMCSGTVATQLGRRLMVSSLVATLTSDMGL
jgi:hypothetical protein